MALHEFTHVGCNPKLVSKVLRELNADILHPQIRLIMISPVSGYHFETRDDSMQLAYQLTYYMFLVAGHKRKEEL